MLVENAEEQKLIPADTVIMAFGIRARSEAADAIFNRYPHARLIGDCTTVGQIGEAVRAGFFAGWWFH